MNALISAVSMLEEMRGYTVSPSLLKTLRS